MGNVQKQDLFFLLEVANYLVLMIIYKMRLITDRQLEHSYWFGDSIPNQNISFDVSLNNIQWKDIVLIDLVDRQ